VAQAISWLLSTAADRVRTQIRSCGICVEQNRSGADFLRVLLFFLPIIPPNASHLSLFIIVRGLYNWPVVASVIVDLATLHEEVKPPRWLPHTEQNSNLGLFGYVTVQGG
jgi:hypothetical protein